MFRKGLFLGSVLFCLFISNLNADLFVFYVCDTLGRNIEYSVAGDLRNMRSFAREVAKNTKLRLHEVVYTGENAYPEEILDQIKELSLNSNDIVIFYFSGHGDHRESKRSPWPDLYFSITDQSVDYNHICSILASKNPKFLLAIADCCNSYVADYFAAPLVEEFEVKGSVSQKNYRKLFLEQSGVIQITSSSVGEISWASEDGGIYTQEFIKSMKVESRNRRGAAWDSLLERAMHHSIYHDQTPYWEISEIPTRI